jgi:hypothetical protein
MKCLNAKAVEEQASARVARVVAKTESSKAARSVEGQVTALSVVAKVKSKTNSDVQLAAQL